MHPDLVAEVEKQDNIWGLVLFVLSILGVLATAIADILDIYEFLLTEWFWHARASNIQVKVTHVKFLEPLTRGQYPQHTLNLWLGTLFAAQQLCSSLCADVLMC